MALIIMGINNRGNSGKKARIKRKNRVFVEL